MPHKKNNPLTIDDITKSELAPVENTFTEFKKKTLGVLRHYEEEDFKKTLEIDMYREGAHFTKIERDKLKEENNELKARNQYLEKNNGNSQIKEIHNELKKDHLTEARKEKIMSDYEKKKKAFFESQGISKYLKNPVISDALSDPKISAKKKRKF